MAVATPVIERRISQLTSERENNAGMNADAWATTLPAFLIPNIR